MEPVAPTGRRVKFQTTADGSLTALHSQHGEAYHSVHGALTQARHLYLELTQTHQHPAPRVLELGFGLGVNFWVTLHHCVQRGVRLEYLAYEAEPVSAGQIHTAVEGLELGGIDGFLLDQLCQNWSPSGLIWEGDWGLLEVQTCDIRSAAVPAHWATAIYLDPFSPQTNPQAWELSVLQQLALAAAPGAYLATYSVAGSVRRGLQQAGFTVQKVAGRGKRAWLQAHIA
jgi:tRNA U34 5-methylaminomethyl-2-thiouridine-forming methyltransferase MnmC